MLIFTVVLHDIMFVPTVLFQVLIFSQMTKMLDIIEDFAGLRQYSFCRLDGSVSLTDRQEQVSSLSWYL